MNVTLNKIRSKPLCTEGWKKLLTSLRKTKADDEPLSLITILDSNGLDDALWCLRTLEGHDKEIYLYAVWCARQVQHLMEDERSIKALDVAEAFANGLATKQEIGAASVAAWAASDAAWTDTWAATAAWAASDAAWDADAATAAAARDAAKDAAARAAAAAARAAAAAKAAAAWDADAARDAARDAAKDAQEKEFRRVFK